MVSMHSNIIWKAAAEERICLEQSFFVDSVSSVRAESSARTAASSSQVPLERLVFDGKRGKVDGSTLMNSQKYKDGEKIRIPSGLGPRDGNVVPLAVVFADCNNHVPAISLGDCFSEALSLAFRVVLPRPVVANVLIARTKEHNALIVILNFRDDAVDRPRRKKVAILDGFI